MPDIGHQLIPALIASLLLEGVDAKQIERAITRVRDLSVGQSLSAGDPLIRAFAFEQEGLLTIPLAISSAFGAAREDAMSEYDDWPFCGCGVTLLDGEDECVTCAESPHGRECDCHECADYWHEIAERSRTAADRANRALVCSCGWTGAFIEHHNSEAYGATARAGCEITYRHAADERQRLVRKAWTGSDWRQVAASSRGFHPDRVETR